MWILDGGRFELRIGEIASRCASVSVELFAGWKLLILTPFGLLHCVPLYFHLINAFVPFLFSPGANVAFFMVFVSFCEPRRGVNCRILHLATWPLDCRWSCGIGISLFAH